MKKITLIAALALALPLAAVAQTSAAPATKGTQAKTAAAKPKGIPKRIVKKVEEVKPVSTDTDIALSPEDMGVAEQVLTGNIKCELGASVDIQADAAKPGFFTLTHNKVRYRMHPVESRTGAIRLEDPRAQAMWLQLGNKSMLMSQKQGLRLADECQATVQAQRAEQMKKEPPRSLFEGADPQPGAAK